MACGLVAAMNSSQGCSGFLTNCCIFVVAAAGKMHELAPVGHSPQILHLVAEASEASEARSTRWWS